ncbi:WD40-repeat-containing domain protein [Butyriboletus roseoflavus]|nr:WD40-repeat-containing domain protein [Butyriboletus roseoflavus]
MRMSSTNTDPTIVLETGDSGPVYAVAFHPDEKHLLGGGRNGIRRWRLVDGQQVGTQTATWDFNAIAVSRNHKWVVCGTDKGAQVWNAEVDEKVVEVEGRNRVSAVDVSADSAKFATGTQGGTIQTSVWSISSGKRLVGPLRHDEPVTGVRFSPDGEQIATSSDGGSVRIFDSRNGDQLIDIETVICSIWPITPLAWSNDGQSIFTVSDDKKIRSFNVSTGSQIAESPTLDGDNLKHKSISLAPNGKFIATVADHGISFLDTSTLSHIVPTIKEREDIYIFPIAISPDGSYLATGQDHGKVNVHNLGSILPDSYGPFHASTREERRPDKLPSTSAGHDNKTSDTDSEEPGRSGQLKSKARSDDDGDLLEVEVPTTTPATQFDYDESLSPVSSVHSREDEVPPRGLSPAVAQRSDALPVTSPPEMSGGTSRQYQVISGYPDVQKVAKNKDQEE